MLSQRLSIALADGQIALPETGRIVVLEPDVDSDLSTLPMDRTTVVSRHFPTHKRFETMGYKTSTSLDDGASISIVCLPRAKDEAHALIAEALARTDGPLIVDGQKTDGVESILKALKKRADVSDVIVKAHGKLFQVRDADCEDWIARPGSVVHNGTTFQTRPGVFSADAVDPGSEALVQALPTELKGNVIDLGAGWGFLSHHALRSSKIKSLGLVEADHAALEAARINVTDARAVFFWGDARTFSAEPVDHVIMNPPFHTGRSTNPGLGQDFIRAAARLLKPRGQLWLVANRHLPYEKTLETAFREVRTLAETAGYKITHAQAPRASRKG